MHMKTLGGIVCVVLLGACAQVPRPSTYPYSFQQKIQAAHHRNSEDSPLGKPSGGTGAYRQGVEPGCVAL